MKMLTGLLPASDGEARVFGQRLDAQALQTRKRVGFMSQASRSILNSQSGRI